MMIEKPVLITGKAQKYILEHLDELTFNLAYSETSRKMKMALATLYDAWRCISANNDVEVRMFINGREIGRCPVKKLSLIKPRRRKLE